MAAVGGALARKFRLNLARLGAETPTIAPALNRLEPRECVGDGGIA